MKISKYYLDKYIRIFRLCREYIIVIAYLFMIAFTFISVIFRYLPWLSPIFWSEEILRYIFVWVVFLGFSLSIEKKELLGVDFFINSLPEKAKAIIEIICDLLSAGFSVVLIVMGIKMVFLNYAQRASALPIRMSWIYLAIPTGMILAFFALSIQIKKNIDQYLSRKGDQK